PRAPSLVLLRIPPRQVLRDRREVRLRLRDGDAILQTSDDRQVMSAALLAKVLEDRILGKGSPELRRRRAGRRLEERRHHADDRERPLTQVDGLAEDSRLRRETLAP